MININVSGDTVRSNVGSSRRGSVVSKEAALVWMTIVLLLAFALGANGLNSEPIWADELYSLTNMGVFDPPYSPADIINSITTYSSDHVPFYYFLGAAWAQLAGWTQVSMRLFSVLIGVLTVAYLYRLASVVFCRRTGLVAALLLATSTYVILFFHDIRMYTLLLMLTALHSWLYWRLAHRRHVTRITWLLLFATALLLLYTHVFALLVFAQLGLYHLLFAPRSRRWKQILASWTFSFLFFLPYLPTLVSAILSAAEIEKVTTAAATIPELIWHFLFLLVNGSAILVPVFLGSVLWALWRKRDRSAFQFVISALLVVLLIGLLNELVGIIPISRMRYFLILWIPFVMICAWGVTSLPRWHLAALCSLVWIIAGFQFNRSQQLQDYIGGMKHALMHPPLHRYTDALLGKVREEDYLLGFSFVNQVNTEFKFGQNVIDYYTAAQLGIDGAFIPNRWRDLRLQNDIVRKIDRHPYLLFTYNPGDLPPNFTDVSAYVEENYIPCAVIVDTSELHVQRHTHPLAGCDRAYAPISYENGISIVDKFGKYDPDRDVVRVVTGWEIADEQQLDQYNVSIQIITPDWQMRKQVDRHLYNRIVKWNEVELPTEGLEPGDYRLVVILYDRNTNEKVQGTDLRSGETSVILPILTFTIEP